MRRALAVQAVAPAGVHRLFHCDLAGHRQHHVGRRVEGAGAAVEQLRGQPGDAVHRAGDVVAQRVAAVQAAEQGVEQPPVGAVVVHLDLLPDDALFLGDGRLSEPGFAHEAEQDIQVLVDFLRGREQVAGAVIAGERVGRSARLGIEAERVALGRFAHFVFQEMGRARGQRDRLAVQQEIPVDGTERRSIDGVDAAVARHGAAEHRQAAGQHGLFAAHRGRRPPFHGGEGIHRKFRHLRRPLSLPFRVWPSRHSTQNSGSPAGPDALRPG